MRWRGLARPWRARQPITRRPMRRPAATGYRAPRGFAGCPAPPHVPRVSPGIGPPSVVRDFLLPPWQVAQGVRRVITRFFWLSTGRVALIHRTRLITRSLSTGGAQAGRVAPMSGQPDDSRGRAATRGLPRLPSRHRQAPGAATPSATALGHCARPQHSVVVSVPPSRSNPLIPDCPMECFSGGSAIAVACRLQLGRSQRRPH